MHTHLRPKTKEELAEAICSFTQGDLIRMIWNTNWKDSGPYTDMLKKEALERKIPLSHLPQIAMGLRKFK